MSERTSGIAHGLPYVIDVEAADSMSPVRVAGTVSGHIYCTLTDRWRIKGDPTAGHYDTMHDAATAICGMVGSAQLAAAHTELTARQRAEADRAWQKTLRETEREQRHERESAP